MFQNVRDSAWNLLDYHKGSKVEAGTVMKEEVKIEVGGTSFL